jgi:hypothetical protein
VKVPLLPVLFANRKFPVSQILISHGGVMSESAQAATASVKKLYGTKAYELYDDTTLRAFIEQHFTSDVLAAYDSLLPYAYKADLGRYCLLYVKGGWYFDIGVKAVSSLRASSKTEMIYFRDIQKNSKTSWASSTGILFCRPGSAVIKTAIDLVLENVKNKHYGITPLCPTGPVVFGRALAIHGANGGNVIGDYLPRQIGGKIVNSYVMPSGRIVALGKAAEGGSFSDFVSRGSNNYNVLWRKRKVYR